MAISHTHKYANVYSDPNQVTFRAFTSMQNSGTSELERWQNFLLCVIFHLFLPLSPLLLELWGSASITAKSATLAAAIYAITMGNSSQNKLIFGLGVLISLIFTFAYARSYDGELIGSSVASYWAIGFILLIHGIERYKRHIISQQPFWEF
jgi:hypothetical protein